MSELASAQLSAPELYSLLAAGYEPVGLAMGVAAVSMGTRGFFRSIKSSLQAGEVSAISDASLKARKLALGRAEKEAQELGADLFLTHHWEVRDMTEIVEVTCVGNAVKKVGDFKPMPIANATS